MNYSVVYLAKETKNLIDIEQINEIQIIDSGSLHLSKEFFSKDIVVYLHPKNFPTIKEKLDRLVHHKKTIPHFKCILNFDELESYYDQDKDIKFYQMLQKYEIEYLCVNECNSWEDFYVQYNIGIKDILISGDLGFELPAVSSVAAKLGIKLRAYPIYTEQRMPQPYQEFFIRPEDVDLYSNYIDTFVFIVFTQNQLSTIVKKTYIEDKKWFGQLNTLMPSLDVNNAYLLDTFAERRLTCARKCLKGKKCNLCKTFIESANAFEKAGLYVK